MFTIDLLKGQGIPIKSRPGGAVFVAVIIAVPVILTMIMLGDYVRGSIILTTQQRFLGNIEADILKYSQARTSHENARQWLEDTNACLTEAADMMKYQIQWSPVLEILAKNMPVDLVLSELNLRTETINKEVPKRDEPSKKITITVPKRILTITFYGNLGSASDLQALEFLKAMNVSGLLSKKIETVRIISQTADSKTNTMHYVIECVFKP